MRIIGIGTDIAEVKRIESMQEQALETKNLYFKGN